MVKKVVLAYSGGFDTAIIVPRPNENHGYVEHVRGDAVNEHKYKEIVK